MYQRTRTSPRGAALWRVLAALTLAVPLLTTAADWPTYLHDAQRSAASPDETLLSPANADQLAPLWSYRTGGVIAASAAVVSGTVYVGSWDGYEYALDAATGALRWKTYLGVTTSDPSQGCDPSAAGVTSSATVQDGVVYVGGGDAYWYALDATTGAVLWKVYTGDNSPSGGHYNWSSPLIYNGYAYIGVASFGDCPLVRGQLLQVDLSTHQIVNTFNAVPNGQIGGGIWTSPSVDPATNTIYVTTGTEGEEPASTQPLALALVALDATTLAVKSSWQLPPADQAFDSDWGTTPVLFTDGSGDPLVAATNKNGYVYTFNRTTIDGGPLWKKQIADASICPQCGGGNVSPGAFAGGSLYMAGGETTIGTVAYSGSVRALDPATGAYLWQHGTSGAVIGALAYADGLIVDGAAGTLEVLSAATGRLLFAYHTGLLYAAPSVADGRIYEGATDGTLYAFGITATTPGPTPGPGSGVAVPLAPYYGNSGISSDAAPAAANFDGGGASYSAEALAAAGLSPGQTVVYDGVAFQWPDVTPGALDNVVAQGQAIGLATPVTGTTLAFLGAASGGATAGMGAVSYADGSTQSFTVGLSDWTLDGGASATPAYSNTIVAAMPYRNRSSGAQDEVPTYLFYVAVPLANSAVTGVTLPAPSGPGVLHIFAASILPYNPPAAATSVPPTPTVMATSVPPTPMATATATFVPPTPTATTTATATSVPPTATATSVPPTPTAMTPAATPTAMAPAATPTAIATGTPTSMVASPTTPTAIGTPSVPTVSRTATSRPVPATATATSTLALATATSTLALATATSTATSTLVPVTATSTPVAASATGTATPTSTDTPIPPTSGPTAAHATLPPARPASATPDPWLIPTRTPPVPAATARTTPTSTLPATGPSSTAGPTRPVTSPTVVSGQHGSHRTRLPLTVAVTERHSGGKIVLTIRVRTAPRARLSVVLSLKPAPEKTRSRGLIRLRQPIPPRPVTLRGQAGSRGLFSRRVRLAHRPPGRAVAVLVVRAQGSSGVTVRTTRLALR